MNAAALDGGLDPYGNPPSWAPRSRSSTQQSHPQQPPYQQQLQQRLQHQHQHQHQYQQMRNPPSRAEAMYTDTSTSRARHHYVVPQSPSGALPGGDYYDVAQPLAAMSPRQTPVGSSRALPNDHLRSSSHHGYDAPLTLHIPQVQDLPKISSANSANPGDHHNNYSSSSSSVPLSNTSTLLPSFASLQEQTARTDDVDGPEIAPMSSRLSCHMCTKLKPMVREVALAVADLDEAVQGYCSKSMTRPLDVPSDSPVRCVQWILERLRQAKFDVQEASRRSAQPGYFYADQAGPTPSRTMSPGGPKRPGEPFDREDPYGSKRPRSGSSLEHSLPAYPMREEHRQSMDFHMPNGIHRSAFSPPPSEALSGSANAKLNSPTTGNRVLRALPSPSSMAYAPSAAPSLAQQPSMGSPAPSAYQQGPPMHMGSANSATSAHIADLQHQVTLKSLALQTLQSEYASLLQKLQRERVKSQTIEKKTSVADQEVNELTSRNEELSESVKSLELQLEESEKKREASHAEATREKEQWGRMLDMSGRIQAKVAEEKRKLQDENATLIQRVAVYEESGAARTDGLRKSRESQSKGAEMPRGDAMGASAESSGNVTGLKFEISQLRSRIEVLRSALEEAKRQNKQLDIQAHSFIQQSSLVGTAIDRVLGDDAANPAIDNSSSANDHPSLAQQHRDWPTPSKLSDTPDASHHHPKSTPTPQTNHHQQSHSRSTPRPASATVISPPAHFSTPDMNLETLPTHSTTEDLIKKLGPIPAPPQSVSFLPTPYSYHDDPHAASMRMGNHRLWSATPQPPSWSQDANDSSRISYAVHAHSHLHTQQQKNHHQYHSLAIVADPSSRSSTTSDDSRPTTASTMSDRRTPPSVHESRYSTHSTLQYAPPYQPRHAAAPNALPPP